MRATRRGAMRVTRRLLMAASGSALAIASMSGAVGVAHADDPGGSTPYNGPITVVKGEQVTRAPTVPTQAAVLPAQTSPSGLPVTGTDALGLAVVGVGLVGAGTVLV